MVALRIVQQFAEMFPVIINRTWGVPSLDAIAFKGDQVEAPVALARLGAQAAYHTKQPHRRIDGLQRFRFCRADP